MRKPTSRILPTRLLVGGLLTTALAFGAVACGSDGGSTGSDGSSSDDSSGSTPAANGERLARSKGCAGCHGQDFDGGAGPGWIGLAGSEVVLVDGSTVVADEAYLTRAIADPDAELTEGYSLKMPTNGLSDGEIADIVAFIQTLSDDAATGADETGSGGSDG